MQVATAILSTTVKTEARKKGKKEDDSDKMEVVKEETKEIADSAETKDDAGKKEGEVKKEGEEGESEKKETDKKKEPSSTSLANPARYIALNFATLVRKLGLLCCKCRIVPAQKKFVSIKSGAR